MCNVDSRIYPYIVFRHERISQLYGEAIARTFESIIKAVLFSRDVKIGEQFTLTNQDKAAVVSWNPTRLRTHANCLHHLVEAKVQDLKELEAICAWDGNVSYAELDSFACLAAMELMEAGIRPGHLIPFAFEKSLWAVVSAYAIMKTGAAFVPVDPTHPEKRLREVLRVVKAPVVVTSEMHARTFEHMAESVLIISGSTIKRRQRQKPNSGLRVEVTPSDPILVLFTSGSTGKPKGMVLEHSAICTHALTHGDEMGYHGARVLQFANHTFDVAVMDFFTTLLYGGTVCIPSEADRQSDIIGAISRMQANYAILTPSFSGLIEPSEVTTLKTLAVGGEKLSHDRVTKWKEQARLLQIYGPAEVGICMQRRMDEQRPMPENVGYTLANCSCWLVDPEDVNKLVPLGAIGELVIASSSMARGYLNDEVKTRASFIDNLAWAKSVGLARSTRFYKTGDLLRYNTTLHDGSFDFCGRIDTQIKLRGQRMELGELEHHIASMPDVAVSGKTLPTDLEVHRIRHVLPLQRSRHALECSQIAPGYLQLARES